MDRMYKTALVADFNYWEKEGLPESGCFGYLDGHLILGEGHHQLIMAKLIDAGWTWEQLFEAEQAWGWFSVKYPSSDYAPIPSYYFEDDEGHQYPAADENERRMRLVFSSDAGIQNADAMQKASAAFAQMYKMPVMVGDYVKDALQEGNEYGQGLKGKGFADSYLEGGRNHRSLERIKDDYIPPPPVQKQIMEPEPEATGPSGPGFPPPHASSIQKFAEWEDVMEKAQKIRQMPDGVQITVNEPDHVIGKVHSGTNDGTYDTEIWRDDPNSQAITMWDCSCPWSQYSWGRTRQWKRYEGRPCAHTLALFWQAQQTPPAAGQGQAAPAQKPPTPVPGGDMVQQQGLISPVDQPALISPMPMVQQQPPGVAIGPSQVIQGPAPAAQGPTPTMQPTPTDGGMPGVSAPSKPGQGGSVGIPGALSSWKEAAIWPFNKSPVEQTSPELQAPTQQFTHVHLPVDPSVYTTQGFHAENRVPFMVDQTRNTVYYGAPNSTHMGVGYRMPGRSYSPGSNWEDTTGGEWTPQEGMNPNYHAMSDLTPEQIAEIDQELSSKYRTAALKEATGVQIREVPGISNEPGDEEQPFIYDERTRTIWLGAQGAYHGSIFEDEDFYNETGLVGADSSAITHNMAAGYVVPGRYITMYHGTLPLDAAQALDIYEDIPLSAESSNLRYNIGKQWKEADMWDNYRDDFENDYSRRNDDYDRDFQPWGNVYHKWSYNNYDGLEVWPVDRYGMPDHWTQTGERMITESQGHIYPDGAVWVWPERPSNFESYDNDERLLLQESAREAAHQYVQQNLGLESYDADYPRENELAMGKTHQRKETTRTAAFQTGDIVRTKYELTGEEPESGTPHLIPTNTTGEVLYSDPVETHVIFPLAGGILSPHIIKVEGLTYEFYADPQGQPFIKKR